MKFYWRKCGNNYLSLIFTDKKKEVFIKYKEFWDKIKNLIKKINGGKAGSTKKISWKSNLIQMINKMLKLHNMAIVIRSVFQEGGKYYPQVFLDECLYEL